MRKLNASLIVAVAIAFSALSQSALAGSKTTGKASPNLYKSTAKGEHYKEVTITTRTKSKGKTDLAPITIKKTTDKASP